MPLNRCNKLEIQEIGHHKFEWFHIPYSKQIPAHLYISRIILATTKFTDDVTYCLRDLCFCWYIQSQTCVDWKSNPTAVGSLLTCSTEHCYCRIPKPAPVSEEVKRIADKLPEIFDWRTTGFVSPVRNQGR